MNNFEKIKSMTVNEMAEWLSGDCDNYCYSCNCEGDCLQNIKQWLESEE